MGVGFEIFAAMIPILILVAAAAVVWRVFQGTVARREFFQGVASPQLEARLTRIEEAIDAISTEVERLSVAERERVRASTGAALPPASRPDDRTG